MEAYAFPECFLHLWTGSHTASGNVILYVQNININQTYEWDTQKSLSGTYRDHAIGRAAQLQLGRVYTPSAYLDKIAASATAVHFKLTFNHFAGSAGWIYYSGRLDNVGLAASLGNGAFMMSVAAHANNWTGF